MMHTINLTHKHPHILTYHHLIINKPNHVHTYK